MTGVVDMLWNEKKRNETKWNETKLIFKKKS